MGDYFVPTKSCPTSTLHVVHEFNKQGKKTNPVKPNPSEPENVEEVMMKKARFEIYKFAQSGLPNAERQKSQFDLALKLGAVPKKNSTINYKKLKEEKQALKQVETERKTTTERNMKSAFRRKNKDPKKKLRRKRKVGSGILKSYGQISR